MAKIGISVNSSALNSIYQDYKPAYKNLYTVEIFTGPGEDLKSDLTNYIRFHTPSVSFEEESLTLKRNEVTKNFHVESSNIYKWASTLTISWRESDDWKVKKYHEFWLSCFYDKNSDCFLSYPLGENESLPDFTKTKKSDLYRSIRITLPVSIENKDADNQIVFYDVLPQNTGNFNLGWSESGTIVEHTINYYVKNWKWTSTDINLQEEDS